MGLTREQKAGNVRVNLGYVVLEQDNASHIYDRLCYMLDFEECFAHDVGEDNCEHCQVEISIEILKQGGLKNDRLTSIEKDQASE